MISKLAKIFTAAAMFVFCLNVSGQDLLARQAPIDRKLKIVDSVALVRQIKAEQSAYPAYDLYPSWSHEFVNAYGSNVQMPDTFRISLEDFCMPTESTKITDVFGYRPRRRRMHYGLDVKVFIGDTIRAAFAGKVRIVKDQGRRKGYVTRMDWKQFTATCQDNWCQKINMLRLANQSHWVVIPVVQQVHTYISRLVS